MDEKKEAKLAVDSYLFHWEKSFTLQLDAKMKEKRDKETKGHALKPYLSHRLSGQISQLADFTFSNHVNDGMARITEDNETCDEAEVKVTGVIRFMEPGEESPRTGTAKHRESYSQRDKFVIIDQVEGETVADVIGVLITGMRIILLQHEGNIDLLKEASQLGEKAFVIITEHGFLLPNYHQLLARIYQWLGLVYSELALEVVEREERHIFQTEAIVMLSKGAQYEKNDALIHYQLALALVEGGEVSIIN